MASQVSILYDFMATATYSTATLWKHYIMTATEAPNHNTVLAVDSGHGCCCYLYAGPETLPPFILIVYRLVHTWLG